MITFTCLNCSEPLEAPDSLRGQNIDCPKCRFNGVVPNHSLMSTTPAPPVIDPDNNFYVGYKITALQGMPLGRVLSYIFFVILFGLGIGLLIYSLERFSYAESNLSEKKEWLRKMDLFDFEQKTAGSVYDNVIASAVENGASQEEIDEIYLQRQKTIDRVRLILPPEKNFDDVDESFINNKAWRSLQFGSIFCIAAVFGFLFTRIMFACIDTCKAIRKIALNKQSEATH